MNIPSLASSACLGAELSKSEAFPYREFVSRIRNGAHDAPRSRTGQFACQVENFILNVKHERASWGARKIRERLLPGFPEFRFRLRAPSMPYSNRHGLVERRGVNWTYSSSSSASPSRAAMMSPYAAECAKADGTSGDTTPGTRNANPQSESCGG